MEHERQQPHTDPRRDGAPLPAPAPHDPSRHVAGPRAATAVRTLACVNAAAAFVARIAELDLAGVRAFIRGWHRAVAEDADRWFAAEAAVSEAVVRSGRAAEQRVLLRHMAETFTNGVWYRWAAARAALPERRVRATEASGQYSATLAMLALLVRDHLDPRHFAVVYAPFAPLIPVSDLLEDGAGST